MSRKLSILFLILAVTTSAFAQKQDKRRSYCLSCILPEKDATQAHMDSLLIQNFDKWRSLYLRHLDHTDQVYAVNQDNTHQSAACTSESQSFSMVIVALVGKLKPELKTLYDSLYRYYMAHPTIKTRTDIASAHLMAEGIDEHGVEVDSTAATDGDIDIAFSLLLADKVWGNSDHTVNYHKQGLSLVQTIMKYEINPLTFTIFLDDEEECDADYKSNKCFGTRSSDFMPATFRVFKNLTQDKNWSKVIDTEYKLFETIQTNGGALISDYIIKINNKPRPPHGKYQERSTDGDFSFNACRVPWRIATDYLLSGTANQDAFTFLTKMNDKMYSFSKNDANQIFSYYTLDGQSHNKHQEFFFIAPFAVSAMIGEKYRSWLDNLWNYLLHPPEEFTSNHPLGTDYFGETIRLYDLCILTGNYWVPKY